MSTPQTYALEIYRGDSYAWQFVLWADANKTQPADLAGVVPAAQIRQGSAAPTTLACALAGNIITVSLSAMASGQLAATASQWDLQLTYPSGDVKTIVAGPVSVLRDVTYV